MSKRIIELISGQDEINELNNFIALDASDGTKKYSISQLRQIIQKGIIIQNHLAFGVVRVEDPSAFVVKRGGKMTDLLLPASNKPDGSDASMTNAHVHISIVKFAQPWNGYEWWASTSPYPDADPTLENPTIIVSMDGKKWFEPPGIQNPVAPFPVGSNIQGDPALFYDEIEKQLILYYLRSTAQPRWETYSRTSKDGIIWTEPVLRKTSTARSQPCPNLVSFINEDKERRYRLYYNQAIPPDATTSLNRKLYYREASTPFGEGGTWDGITEVQCQYTGLDDTVYYLHDYSLQILPGGQYLLCATVNRKEGSSTRTVRLATSDDGVNFNFGRPILRKERPNVWPDQYVYTTSIVPVISGGNLVFMGLSTAREVDSPMFGMEWIELYHAKYPIPETATKMMHWNHKWNLSPSNGTLTKGAGITPLGILDQTSINGAPDRTSDGVIFNQRTSSPTANDSLSWENTGLFNLKEFTTIIRFRILQDPSELSQPQRHGLIVLGNFGCSTYLDNNSNWKVMGGKMEPGALSPQTNPEIFFDWEDWITVAWSWDGQTLRYGSNLDFDIGGIVIFDVTELDGIDRLFIGGGTSQGDSGQIEMKEVIIWDKAVANEHELNTLALLYHQDW